MQKLILLKMPFSSKLTLVQKWRNSGGWIQCENAIFRTKHKNTGAPIRSSKLF